MLTGSSDNAAGKPGAFSWLARRYARRHLGMIGVVVGVTLVGNLLAVLQPAILAGLLANLGGAPSSESATAESWLDLNGLGERVTRSLVGSSAGGTAVVMLFGTLFLMQSVLVAAAAYGADLGAAWLRTKYTKLIQEDLLRHLLGQDIEFFGRERAGELISRVSVDAVNTASALGPLIRSLIHHNVQILVYGAYLVNTSPLLTVGSIGLLALQFGFTQLLKKPVRRLTRQEADAMAELSGAVQETLTSIRVTKSFGAEPFELSRVSGAIERAAASILRRSRIEKAEAPARSIFDALAVLGIFLIAVVQVQQGHLTFQGLLLFTYVGKLLIAPINNSATTALWIEATKAAYGRISELLAQRPQIIDGDTPKRAFEGHLEMKNISFAYGSQPAIKTLTLTVRRGEFIALVGPSGAGKSTLADLLLRLRDPDAGTIAMDGVDIRRYRQGDYRRLFGVVSQETLLFHDSVRNNIRFGRSDLTDADIEWAARAANAHEFILALPNGYDTVVGDRGVRLSGGERQRVAIARAVVHRPQILILDEATSALDSESERLVRDAIDRVVAETTAIVIAHRLSTVMHADRIVVLTQGSVEAAGSHHELLKVSPTYATFCRQQLGRPGEMME